MDPPVFALVDPWWTRREAPRMDAARRSARAATLHALRHAGADASGYRRRYRITTRVRTAVHVPKVALCDKGDG